MSRLLLGISLGLHCLPAYFFGYKKEAFYPFQNNAKILDPSYKMDLDLWDCLGMVELILQQNLMGLI